MYRFVNFRFFINLLRMRRVDDKSFHHDPHPIFSNEETCLQYFQVILKLPEVLENLEEMFPQYCIHSDELSMF